MHVSHATAPNFRLSRTGTGQIYQFGIDSSGRFLIQEAASEGGTKNTRFVIDDTGEVGIGTGSPTHPLHILGTSNDTIDETKGNLKVQGGGGNGLIFGTIASSPYSSYIQSAYVQDTSLAQYNLILNPKSILQVMVSPSYTLTISIG